MKYKNNQFGFTLFELIISLAIIALIAGLSMGGLRLGISAREAGEERANIYQRLRFIGEQISQKIKSAHPLFITNPSISNDILKEDNIFGDDKSSQSNTSSFEKIIAFEGRNDSIRLVTFAHGLSNFKKKPWIHEVSIYHGLNPVTEENGIIMVERDVFVEDVFSKLNPNSEAVTYITLAKDVAFLKFRYYKMRKYISTELKQFEKKSKKYYGEWIDEVISKSTENLIEKLEIGQDNVARQTKNKISLPRAIEISLGLEFPKISGRSENKEIYAIPPTIISLNSGILLSRPRSEEEINEIL